LNKQPINRVLNKKSDKMNPNFKNQRSCPIVAQIKYKEGKLAGINVIRYGDKFIHDGNIPLMVYTLRKMIIKNMEALTEAKIFDNRLTPGNRIIFEAYLLDGSWVTLTNNLATYLGAEYKPKDIGTEVDVKRVNYAVELVKNWNSK